ncbi:MAG: ClC family H(+)/Cl(-) exchange transporter [Schwartzia sp.]|nr:ClC family H(+)/Cl(-) exchange transporter [Schwartzia sp. (in: firmicutes)]
MRDALCFLADERAFRLRLFCEGIMVGVGVGVVISLFRWILELTEIYRPTLFDWLMTEAPLGFAGWGALLVGIAWALARFLAAEPLISGSGIPQVKGILLGRVRMNAQRVLALKFVGGVLAIGAGLSLGREGPSVQLGACVGQWFSRLRMRPRSEERFLLTAGSGAGLAAAFNAPLAGVIFCLEELTKSFSPLVLMATVAASVSAATVAGSALGLAPVFHIGALPEMSIAQYAWLFPLGVFAGALGVLFNRVLVFSLDAYQTFSLRGAAKFFLPLFLSFVFAFCLPEILGGGSPLVDTLIRENFGISFLLLLLTAKFAFTMLCFGSGAPGGIFLPMLVLGALSGAVFAKGALFTGLFDETLAAGFVVYGMAAYFAAVVKSPITGSVLIMEMTGSFHHMLALIFVSMTAFLTADVLRGAPVYEMLLERSLRAKAAVRQVMAHHRTITEFVVGEGSSLDGVKIADVRWPDACLLVQVRRGESELVPTGSLVLQSGDFVYALADDGDIAELEDLATEKPMGQSSRKHEKGTL